MARPLLHAQAVPCHDVCGRPCAWRTVPCQLHFSHLVDTGGSTDEPHRSSSSRWGRWALQRASVDGRAAALGPAAPVTQRSPGSPGAATRLPAATALPGQPAGRERAGLQTAGTQAWGGRPGEPCSRAGLSCLPCFQPRAIRQQGLAPRFDHLSPSQAQPGASHGRWMLVPLPGPTLASGQDSRRGGPVPQGCAGVRPRAGNAPRQPLGRAFPSVPE